MSEFSAPPKFNTIISSKPNCILLSEGKISSGLFIWAEVISVAEKTF